MTTLFDSTRRVNEAIAHVRHVFGQGIPTSDKREPFSQADLDWWAQQNAHHEPDYDRLAAESAWMDAHESWPAERRGTGVRLSEVEEGARYGVPDVTLEDVDQWSEAFARRIAV